jgi:ABC-type uncharacterized transport system ATPase subunit
MACVMTVLIETRDVSKAYDGFTALDRVGLSIRAGEFVSIVGPNGAGKKGRDRVLGDRTPAKFFADESLIATVIGKPTTH